MSDETEPLPVTHLDPLKVLRGHLNILVEVTGQQFEVTVDGDVPFRWEVCRESKDQPDFYGGIVEHGEARFFRDAYQQALTTCRQRARPA